MTEFAGKISDLAKGLLELEKFKATVEAKASQGSVLFVAVISIAGLAVAIINLIMKH